MYSTLAEVQRCCKLVASTATDYSKYNEMKREAEFATPFQFVIEWEEITIYSNELYYIVLQNRGAILSLYKLRNHVPQITE